MSGASPGIKRTLVIVTAVMAGFAVGLYLDMLDRVAVSSQLFS